MSRARVPEREAILVASAALESQDLSPLAASLPDLDLLPPDLAAFVVRRLEASRTSAKALLRVLSETVDRLRSNGCEVVVTGEAVAAVTVYREAALRPARTLRLLLVRRADASRARRSLAPRAPVSLHASLAYRALGSATDLTGLVLDDPVVRTVDGVKVLFASPRALAAQLLFAAAAEFAGDGFPGVSAIDLRLLALALGPLSPDPSGTSRGEAASLIHAVDSVERFCPGTFDRSFVSRLAGAVPVERRELGRRIPPLRFTRARGSGLAPAALIESRLGRLRFLLRRPGLVS